MVAVAFASICDARIDVDAVRAHLLVADGKYLTGGHDAAASALRLSSVEALQRDCEAFCER
jgi:hypothetical protein